ncbi:hypothetical protein TNCV_3674111 [Trichonephila clavipes]|nr:hypothetical protein TNCV_3674111 [Trichonephila clavipes]
MMDTLGEEAPGPIMDTNFQQQFGPHYCRETDVLSELSCVDQRYGIHTVRGLVCRGDIRKILKGIVVKMFCTPQPHENEHYHA